MDDGSALRPRLAARHLLLCLPLMARLAVGAQARTLSVNAPADAYEGNFGKRDLRFPVTLSEAASGPVTFSICFGGTGGTATIDAFSGATIRADRDFQPARLGAPVNGGCASSTMPAWIPPTPTLASWSRATPIWSRMRR